LVVTGALATYVGSTHSRETRTWNVAGAASRTEDDQPDAFARLMATYRLVPIRAAGTGMFTRIVDLPPGSTSVKTGLKFPSRSQSRPAALDFDPALAQVAST
jgi:hypothetical protein